MTSKKEYEQKIKLLEGELEQADLTKFELLNFETEAEELRTLMREQVASLSHLQDKVDERTIVFLAGNVVAYRTKEEKDAALDHIRERMDSELNRLGLSDKFISVVLPDTVTALSNVRI